MKRCARLTIKQKSELAVFIQDKERSVKEVKRAQAILLLDETLSDGIAQTMTGYSRRRIYFVRQAYLMKGLAGITDKRQKPVKRLLTLAQREEIAWILMQEKPPNYGYRQSEWTTAILADLIEARYRVRYQSKTSYYVVFTENRFSFHKPGKVYEKHDAGKVAAWQKAVKPKISKAFKEDDTIILAGDEMVLSSQTTFQKVWLPINAYPKIAVSNTKENRSIYGFLAIKTGRVHAYVKERQTMFTTVECLEALRNTYPTKKLVIVWDNAGWHKGSAVQQFIKEDKRIQVIPFPAYSPEENPQEHVWKKGREQVTHNRFIHDIKKVIQEFVDYLQANLFPYSLLGFSALL